MYWGGGGTPKRGRGTLFRAPATVKYLNSIKVYRHTIRVSNLIHMYFLPPLSVGDPVLRKELAPLGAIFFPVKVDPLAPHPKKQKGTPAS